jgi:hypothetical protein
MYNKEQQQTNSHEKQTKMKKVLAILFAMAMVIAVANLMTGCTKEGPQGEQGPAGTNGTNGTNGEDGEDANATCTQCHNFSDELVAKIAQYDHSQHAEAETVFENAVGCAPCHDSQGFIEVVETGLDETAEVISDPAPINCRTCHKIHDTYTTEDYALRYNSPVALRIGGELNLSGGSGNANLCSKCHQPRKRTPWPDDAAADSLTPTSFRYNPHYGTQSTILAGMGAWELPGVGTYGNSPHRDALSCTDCHGAEAVGIQGGGHSLRMAYELEGEESENVEACQTCHPDLESFDYEGVQTEIAELELQLEELLIAKGIMDPETGGVFPGKTYHKNELRVMWNWGLVHYDRSAGVHNYKYSRDVLQGGIDYLNAN